MFLTRLIRPPVVLICSLSKKIVYLYTYYVYKYTMKNVTLSIPEDVLRRSREYARKHGTTLNDLVRNLLRKTISDHHEDFEKNIDKVMGDMGVDTTHLDYRREDLYER